jgi:dephospho-CoA kinase
MKVIGLTGGIATGKSTVSKIIQDEGLVVVDADILAREVVSEGSFGLRALVQIFGDEIVNRKGEKVALDRNLLAQKLFSDPECRRVIENITHPLIQWRAKQEIERLGRQGEKIVFYDAALIFEKDLAKNFDRVVVVNANPEEQKKRLMNRDGLDFLVAEKKIETQMPMSKKVAAADFVIDNSGSVQQTKEQVRRLLDKLQKE